MHTTLYRARKLCVASGIALAGGALVLAGCSAGGDRVDEDGVVTVNLAYSASSAMSAAPFAVGTANGYFEDGGCRIGEQLEESQGGSNTLRGVLDGGLDMGEVATNAVLDGVLNSGEEITIVGSSHQTQYDFNYGVRPDSGITSVEDLAGKVVGYTGAGSASEDMAILLADSAGLVPGEDLELAATNGVGGGVAMLEGGDVDAILLPPTVAQQNADTIDIGIPATDVIDAIGPYQKTAYIVSDAFAEEQPDAVACVLDGLNQAMQFIEENPEDAAQMYADANEDFTVDDVMLEFEAGMDGATLEGGVGFNPEGYENVARARVLRDGDDTPVPWADLMTTEFLPDGVSTEVPGE